MICTLRMYLWTALFIMQHLYGNKTATLMCTFPLVLILRNHHYYAPTTTTTPSPPLPRANRNFPIQLKHWLELSFLSAAQWQLLPSVVTQWGLSWPNVLMCLTRHVELVSSALDEGLRRLIWNSKRFFGCCFFWQPMQNKNDKNENDCTKTLLNCK